jgi:hypothetical protein
MAGQYLEFGRDPRKAAATRYWLVTAFVAAARKRQDFATARLLAIRPSALAARDTTAGTTPSLDDFAAEHDPDGFHTERTCSSCSPRTMRARARTALLAPRRCAYSSATRACASGR